jgi:hypothetical protein
MSDQPLRIGDRVEIYLDSAFWESEGWFPGVVVRIDPYSAHRSFYWVALDTPVAAAQGGVTQLVSVFNVKKIKRI